MGSRSTKCAANHNLDTGYYVRRNGNPPTKTTKEIRRKLTLVLLSHLKRPGCQVTVFVNENSFTVDEVVNRQNSQIIATGLAKVPRVLGNKHLAPVRVFDAIIGDGRVTLPSFVPTRLKIGTTEHLAIMEGVMVPGLGHRYTLNDMASMRGSEPAPTAQQARNLLKRKIPKHVPKGVWPPAARASAQTTNDACACGGEG